MKNTLTDLNNFLFAQLERLDNEELSKEDLTLEINRAGAISKVASQVIQNSNTVLKAMKFADEKNDIDRKMPKLLGVDE